MKKIFRNSMLVVMGLLFFACEAEEPEIYSCNPEMDKWAHHNLSDIRNMKRADWNNLDEAHKQAAYVAFTQEQRVLLWLGKIEQVLTLQWSNEEVGHILRLKDFITSHQKWFNDEILTEDQENELLLFGYQWMEKAKELGWTKTLSYAIITTPNNLIDKEGNIEFISNHKRVLSRSEATKKKDCNCHKTIDSCGLEGGTCDGVDCEEVKKCFILNLLTCNGRCSGILQ